MKILFVVNPVSGGKSNEKIIELIHEKSHSLGIDVEILNTTGEGDDEAVQEHLHQYKPDRVVAGGGDGTIQLLARNIVHKNFLMGILPLGSANGLATAIGVPAIAEEALEIIFNGNKTKPLDLLKINNKHYCAHLADIGINARMIKDYAAGGDRGMMGYAKHLVNAIKESPLLKYTIITPEQTYTKEGYMLMFANADKYGTGIKISEGSVSDGKFEICSIEKISLDEAIKAGLTKFNLFIDEDMFSDVISSTHAEVTIDRKVHLQIDGEYMGTTDHLFIDIVPAAVTVLIGEN